MRRWWAPPDPGLGVGIEVLGREMCGDGQVLVIGEVLAREGFAPKDVPPTFDQVKPGGAHRKGEGVHPPVLGKPVLDGWTGVTGEVIGDEIEVTGRIGLRHGGEQGQIAGGIARECRLGEDLPVLDPEGTVDPDLVGAAPIRQMGLDAVSIG